jgi:hypothetical protein
MRDWKPGDIFEVPCPWCGGRVEFFKDEPRQKCPDCKRPVKNPKINTGCLEWCPFAKECAGVQKDVDKT